jgi:PAS domain S-box-containing protein
MSPAAAGFGTKFPSGRYDGARLREWASGDRNMAGGAVGPEAGARVSGQTDQTLLISILTSSPDAIWCWRIDGTITHWNPAAERLLGHAAIDMVDRALFDLIPSSKQAAAEDVIAQIKEGTSFAQYETVRLRKDGVAVDVELTVAPLRDQNGVIIGGATFCRDIRDRKRVENSLARTVRELGTLFHLTERLQAASCVDQIYDAALEAITEALECERASILLFDSASIMRFVAWKGLTEKYRRAVDGHSPWTPDSPNPTAIFVQDIRGSNEPDTLKQVIEAEDIRGLAFIPLVANGRVLGKFMTYYRRPHEFNEREVRLASTIARQLSLYLERKIAEDELRESEFRFRLMSENAPVMIWISDASGKCLHLNRMLRNFWGLEEVDVAEFDWSTTMHPDDAPLIQERVGASMAKRTSFEVKGRYRNAVGRYRVLETLARPRIAASGEFLGMIGVNVDVTEREEAEKARELLVAELNHRVKNTLAIVQGIALQTFRIDSPPREARRAFEGRLIALAHAHNLLTQANWEEASLEELASLTLQAQGVNATRMAIKGPPISLAPKQAVSVGLALHELSTNALKYGALSNGSGQVELTWERIDGEQPRLQLKWRESGGPPVQKPTHTGFGSFLLQRTLGQDLNGKVMVNFDPEGVVCLVEAPLRAGVADELR